MPSELKLPELGENIAQGTITKILVKGGDSIKKGQNILELETDKAVLEVPSPVDGVIADVLVKAGATVKVGQAVFTLGGSASPVATPAATVATASSAAPKAPAAAVSAPAPVKVSNEISTLVLPALGENIEKGTVTKVLVNAGDTIKIGQNILELETDKAVLEVPSPESGVIKEVLVKAKSIIQVGEPVFKIQGISTAVVHQPASAPQSSTTIHPESLSKPAASTQAPAAPTSAPTPFASGHAPVRANVPAAPSVRLFARELGIDIGLVPGTGPGGRISIADVKAYCKMLNTTRPAGGTVAQRNLPTFEKWGNVRREAMNNVRKKTAEHLSSAWNTIPHVTQFEKADVTELEKLRKNLSSAERKLSITPFLIKIIANALKKFPQFNTSVDMATQEIIYKDYVNVGVAVDTDRGLLVPVLKNVDKMTVVQISDTLVALAARARDRKTTLDEMSGGSFTISNLGGIGGTFFTPIVNWPEVAILGVSRGVMEPVYVDGAFVPRLMLPLSLSYDHRIIDGADGARFIRFVAESIAKPEGLS